MKILFITLYLPCLILISHFSFSQAPLVKQWDYQFGGSGDEWLYDLQRTTGDGFILIGSSASGISGDKTQPSWGDADYWLVKIDSFGNKEWDKRFGGLSDDWLKSANQTADGGYILGGFSHSDVSGDKTQPSWGGFDYWILKIDSLGNYQWDKRFGGVSDDLLYYAQQTKDGGYII